MIGLAVTQEGLPITHRVFPGATVDVTTLEPMAEELRQRFGLQEAVLVADRGMFSQDSVAALQNSGQRYILALRARQQTEGQFRPPRADQASNRRASGLAASEQTAPVSLASGPSQGG